MVEEQETISQGEELDESMMWQEFELLSPVIDKVAAKWCLLLRGRYDFDELRNECVLAYCSFYPTRVRRKYPRPQFVKTFYHICNNHITNILRRKKVFVSVDDLQVKADPVEFLQMYRNFFFEYMDRFLSGDAKYLVNIVLTKPKELERAHRQRRPNSKYVSGLCRQDLDYLMVREEKWTPARVRKAVKEIREYIVNNEYSVRDIWGSSSVRVSHSTKNDFSLYSPEREDACSEKVEV